MTIDNFHHNLTELFKKSEKELGLKLEEDFEFDALKIFNPKNYFFGNGSKWTK